MKISILNLKCIVQRVRACVHMCAWAPTSSQHVCWNMWVQTCVLVVDVCVKVDVYRCPGVGMCVIWGMGHVWGRPSKGTCECKRCMERRWQGDLGGGWGGFGRVRAASVWVSVAHTGLPWPQQGLRNSQGEKSRDSSRGDWWERLGCMTGTQDGFGCFRTPPEPGPATPHPSFTYFNLAPALTGLPLLKIMKS